MATIQALLMEVFSELEDPRVERTRLHPFPSIIYLGLCGALAGMEGWTDLEDYAASHADFFKERIDLPHGIPSHDTFGRVLGRLDVDAFNRCFMEFTSLLSERLPGVIAIDGKTVRGSGDRKKGVSPLHCVSAWSSANRLVLGQVMADAKSNEITAIPKLLELLDVKDQTVTIDALGCQKEIASSIIGKGGRYVLALKGNQRSLHEDVRLFFEEQATKDFKYFPGSWYEETDGGHGRIEVRRCFATSDIAWVKERHVWEGLSTIAMVESTRDTGEAVTVERRFYIASHEQKAAAIQSAVRSHWGVENQVHWTLDVTCNEDASRIRTGNAPAILTLFRRWALNILRKQPEKISLRRKQQKIAMNPKYLNNALILNI